MIDHLIVTQSAPDLTPLGIEALDGPNPVSGSFDGNRVDVIPVTIYRAEAIPGVDENDPGTPAETAPGFWFAIRASQTLNLPWPVVTVTDSDRAERGEPFVLSVGEGWTWEQLQGRVFPVWAGTDYPFGPDMGPHMLAPPEPEPEPQPEPEGLE